MFTDVMDKQCGQPIGYSPKVASCNTEAESYSQTTCGVGGAQGFLENLNVSKLKARAEDLREYATRSVINAAKQLETINRTIVILKNASPNQLDNINDVLKGFEI